MYLLDSNVLNAYFGRKPPIKEVRMWVDSIDDNEIFISVIIVAEAKRAIEKGRRNANCNLPKLKKRENTLAMLIRAYSSRMIYIDIDTALVWGDMLSHENNEDRTRDLAMAASAKLKNYTVVTRNVSDFQGRGVRILNPFETPPKIFEVN